MAGKNAILMPTNTAISTSSTNHVFLHEWWLVNAKGEGSDGGGGGLAVGGFAHRDSERVNLFCSAPISKRLNATTVLARDSVVVSLNGLINMRHTTSNGYSTEVCNKFMIGFPYDWEEYATCHVQSRGARADVLDRSNNSLGMARNNCETTLEDVPVTSIRDMSKISDLKSLMDEILAKVGHPKEKEEPSVKFAAKRCLSVPPVIDQASGCNKDDDTGTPPKKEPNILRQQEEAICSPNRISTSLSTRRAKRHLKSSPGENSAEYNLNLHNSSVKVETPPSKRKTRSSQLEDAVNCQNQVTNSSRSMNSVRKASLLRDVAGQDQDQLGDIDCDRLTPSKKGQSSSHQTSISPRSIKRPIRASLGQDILEPDQTQLRSTNIEVRSLANKGQSSIINPSSRNGVSTRSMTRLKKPKSIQ